MIYLDDGFYAHPKVIAAGDEATTLYLRGLGWLKQQGSTDGRIPKIVLPVLSPNAKGKPITGRALNALADRLVQVVMWHDDDTHWTVHGYIERNEKAIAKSQQARDAARKRHANAQRTHGRPTLGPDPNHTGTNDASPNSQSSSTPANDVSDAKHRHSTSEPPNPTRKSGAPTKAGLATRKAVNPQVSDGVLTCDRNADADADAADPQMRPQASPCVTATATATETSTATAPSPNPKSRGSHPVVAANGHRTPGPADAEPPTPTAEPGPDGWGDPEHTGPDETPDDRNRRRAMALRLADTIGPNTDLIASNHVVAQALHLAAWHVIDEQIGWLAQADQQPKRPQALLAAVRRMTGEGGGG